MLAQLAADAVGLDADTVKNVVTNADNVKKARKKAYEWAAVGVTGD